jgi:dTDP-4-amino-4,6-dideoxygalactose transaminase
MIPSLKPYLGKEELLAAMRSKENAVASFEEAFAKAFETRFAITFPYGRSGLWAFFRAMEIEESEVVMPAYTCVVVAHAIVLSNNLPRFVDIRLHDYNMDLDQVEAAINERTGAIIATHLFGYPLDTVRLKEIVQAAEKRFGRKIWVIQDCAHAFGATWKGRLVCNEGDAALFGLNISKMITSIFGGMMTTNDPQLGRKLRAFRDNHFIRPGVLKRVRRYLYLLSVYPAFSDYIYGMTYWLQEETPLLDRLTIAYHRDAKIHFPPDHLDQMLEVDARIGCVQLGKYEEIVRRRRENASYYNLRLHGTNSLTLPPIFEGATYSHYVVRVPDRSAIVKACRSRGIHLGEVIQYSVPHLSAYRDWAAGSNFPNSLLCSRHTINLPVHVQLTTSGREKIVRILQQVDSASTVNQGVTYQ